MTTTSDIIFRIGSKMGPGGLASLKAGLDMLAAVGKAVAEDIKGLDKFAQAWQRTNQQAVLMADSAAKGIIDTGKIIEGYNKLTLAGAKISDEQFKILTARTIELARATSKDATEAFDQLTTGIAKGASEALAGFGIKLKQSTDLQETQKNSIEALTTGYEGLTIKAETTSERLYALNNNIDTFKGLLWSAVGQITPIKDALDAVNDSLGEFNEQLAQSPDLMLDFIISADNLKSVFAEMGVSLLQGLATPLRKILNLFSGIPQVAAMGLALQSAELGLGEISAEQWDKLRLKKKRMGEQPWQEPVLVSRGLAGQAPLPEGRAKGKRKGTKETSPESYIAIDTEQMSIDARLAAEEAAFERRMEMAEQSAEITAQTAATEYQAYMETAAGQLELLRTEEYRNEYKQELHDQELVRIQEEQIMREEMGARQLTEMERMLGAEARYGDASTKMWKTGWKAKADILGGVLTDLGVLMHSKSRAMFAIGKAAAISGTIIETASAAMKAYSSLASIPYVGPALGALAAIAVAAAGAVKVRQIRATQFEGGGDVAAGAIATPSLNATTPTATGTSPSYTPTAQEQKPIEVIIRLKDDATSKLFEVFARENEKAKVDGRQGFAVERRVAGWG